MAVGVIHLFIHQIFMCWTVFHWEYSNEQKIQNSLSGSLYSTILVYLYGFMNIAQKK